MTLEALVMLIHLIHLIPLMKKKTVHLMIHLEEDEMMKMRSRWGGSRRWRGQEEEEEGERSRGRS